MEEKILCLIFNDKYEVCILAKHIHNHNAYDNQKFCSVKSGHIVVISP